MAERRKEDLVALGVLGRPHGLRGEARIALNNPESMVLFERPAVFLRTEDRDGLEERRLSAVQRRGQHVVVAFEGVSTRQAAAELCGATLLVARADLPDTDVDEYYDVDLIGLAVNEPDGTRLGRIAAVEHPPAADVIVIELAAGGYVDVPLLRDLIKEIDFESGTIVIALVEGLPRRRRR